MSLPRPISFVTERAARLLRERGPLSSLELAFELLATRAPDEPRARRMLETAFGDDPRLRYDEGRWCAATAAAETPDAVAAGPDGAPLADAAGDAVDDADRALLFLEGERHAGAPFELRSLAALRLRGDSVVAACGGDVDVGDHRRLRSAVRDTIDGAVLVVHDRPGAFQALERWLDEPLDAPISLRRLATTRLGLAASHDLEALAERLGLSWVESDDPLQYADVIDECLRELRRDDESLDDLRLASSSGARPIDWSRYAFDRGFIATVPPTPGTYRFFDREGDLLYVGKSKNLQRRIESYFREGPTREARVQRLLDALHRIEYEVAGSDLEAVLREAAAIRRETPAANVQRRSHARVGRAARLHSILILEPAEPPSVLRAYLIRAGRLVGRIAIGPRGGGLKRIERLLDDHFFSMPDGPSDVAGPDLDVELIVRWLTANRDRAVAFDPTTLGTTREVIDRLRWFLDNGSPFDPDGAPITAR